MARTKSRTAVKNLRIGGRRIPYNVWKAVAAELLEGPEPTRNEIKNGALSKASTLFELCQTDAEWRKKAKACASRLMSAEARKYAAERGWADEAGSPAQTDGQPRTADGEVDYVAIMKTLDPDWQPRTDLFKAPAGKFCRCHKPATVAQGSSDENDPKTQFFCDDCCTRHLAGLYRPKTQPPAFLCSHCGRRPATQEIENPLVPGRWEHYCDSHGPSVSAPPQPAHGISRVRPYKAVLPDNFPSPAVLATQAPSAASRALAQRILAGPIGEGTV